MEWLAELLGWGTAEAWPRRLVSFALTIGVFLWLVYTDFSTTLGLVSIVVVPLLVVAVLVWGRARREEG